MNAFRRLLPFGGAVKERALPAWSAAVLQFERGLQWLKPEHDRFKLTPARGTPARAKLCVKMLAGQEASIDASSLFGGFARACYCRETLWHEPGSVRDVTGKPVGVKFVAGDPSFLDDWFAECVNHPEGCPDYIQTGGGEGGTGAAPAALIDYVGLPITLALPEVAAARLRHGL